MILQNANKLNVTNGLVSGKDDFPGVLFFRSLAQDRRSAWTCTSFLINPTTVITASHCVDPSPSKSHIKRSRRRRIKK